jgi:hypothetical protein
VRRKPQTLKADNNGELSALADRLRGAQLVDDPAGGGADATFPARVTDEVWRLPYTPTQPGDSGMIFDLRSRARVPTQAAKRSTM